MAYSNEKGAAISTYTSPAKRDYITLRRERLGWSQAEYHAQLINFWFGLGCPPLSIPEKHMPALPIPPAAREPMRDYWSDFVLFDPKEDSKPAKLTAAQAEEKSVKKLAARLLKQPRRARRASNPAPESSQGSSQPNHAG